MTQRADDERSSTPLTNPRAPVSRLSNWSRALQTEAVPFRELAFADAADIAMLAVLHKPCFASAGFVDPDVTFTIRLALGRTALAKLDQDTSVFIETDAGQQAIALVETMAHRRRRSRKAFALGEVRVDNETGSESKPIASGQGGSVGAAVGHAAGNHQLANARGSGGGSANEHAALEGSLQFGNTLLFEEVDQSRLIAAQHEHAVNTVQHQFLSRHDDANLGFDCAESLESFNKLLRNFSRNAGGVRQNNDVRLGASGQSQEVRYARDSSPSHEEEAANQRSVHRHPLT